MFWELLAEQVASRVFGLAPGADAPIIEKLVYYGPECVFPDGHVDPKCGGGGIAGAGGGGNSMSFFAGDEEEEEEEEHEVYVPPAEMALGNLDQLLAAISPPGQEARILPAEVFQAIERFNSKVCVQSARAHVLLDELDHGGGSSVKYAAGFSTTVQQIRRGRRDVCC